MNILRIDKTVHFFSPSFAFLQCRVYVQHHVMAQSYVVSVTFHLLTLQYSQRNKQATQMKPCCEIMCHTNKLHRPSAAIVSHQAANPQFIPSAVQGRFLLISYHWACVRSK